MGQLFLARLGGIKTILPYFFHTEVAHAQLELTKEHLTTLNRHIYNPPPTTHHSPPTTHNLASSTTPKPPQQQTHNTTPQQCRPPRPRRIPRRRNRLLQLPKRRSVNAFALTAHAPKRSDLTRYSARPALSSAAVENDMPAAKGPWEEAQ